MAADGRNVTVAELNQRRVEAVRLRLAGHAIDDVAARTGLSKPTVIRAFKAYESGGWDAVPVARRGRRAADPLAPIRATRVEERNVFHQALTIDRSARVELLGQRPCVVWFTGLSGAGKSTIANLLEVELHTRGRATYLLDGDNVRHGLNKDLGFSATDRVENVRRVAEVARLMVDAGLVVIVSLISPFRSERRMARDLFQDDEFVEVYVNTPLALAEQRDRKGLYKKARRGELKNFTGIDSPYEEPERPEVEIFTPSCTPAEAVDRLLAYLAVIGVLATTR